MPTKIYISSALKDADFTRALRERLEAMGSEAGAHPNGEAEFEIFADDDMDPGDSWKLQTERSLKGADVIVLLVSEAFRRSPFNMFEAGVAIAERGAREGVRILPVILGGEIDAETPLADDIQAIRVPRKSKHAVERVARLIRERIDENHLAPTT